MSRFEPLISALAADGWALITDFLDPATPAALAAEARDLWSAGCFRPAGVGHGADRAVREEIRRDHILWLNEVDATPVQRAVWNALRELQAALNRELFLGLQQVEIHYAVYPPAAYYRRHLDRFTDNDSRAISCCLYLNPDWQIEQGGEFRLYLPDCPLDIPPRLGSFLVFRSDVFYHEVLPATAPRFSLTGWFHRRPRNPVWP